MPFCRAFLWILLLSWIFYQLRAFQWSHERQRPVRTLTRIQSPECRMMMFNDTGWMSTANKGLCHINSESPTLSEICPRVWIIFWPGVYGYGESLHQAHKLIARLILETFSIGTQRIGISVSPNNLQFPQHIHWRYCVDPRTSQNMIKKYWWIKPSSSTCNKNKPPKITVNARQL